MRLPDVVAPLAIHPGMKSELSAADLMGESTPLSAEHIRELYVDAVDFNNRWDRAVDDLAELGLMLPEDIAAVKARGRVLTRQRRLPKHETSP